MSKVVSLVLGIFIGGQLWSQVTMVVNSNTQINITNNTALLVHGNIENNGLITVESSSSIIQTEVGGASNSGSGTYVIKRVGLNSPLGYNMWGSPIQSADILTVFSGVNPCDAFAYRASTQEWKYDYLNGFSTTCNGNPVTFQSGQLVSPDGLADGIMDVGRGYFVPGNSNPERTFSGEINNGTYDISIWATTLGDKPDWSGDDWNMVCNPYPSALDLQAFWDRNAKGGSMGQSGTITDGIYFWDHDMAKGPNYHQWSDYAVWNALGYVSSSHPLRKASHSAVASGQGFWVHAAHDGNNVEQIQFDNSMRKSNDNSTFYKRNAHDDNQLAWFTVTLNSSFSNQILLGLTDDATVGYDPMYDARRLHTQAPMEFSFVQDTSLYVILGQPQISFSEQEVIPLHFHTDSLGSFSFQLDSTRNVGGGLTYYLVDSLLNVTHELNVPYTVQLDTGTHDDRFYLLYRDQVNSVEDAEVKFPFVTVSHSNRILNIQSNKESIREIKIYSISGQLIWQYAQLNATKYTVNVGGYAQGTFLVECEFESGYSETKKIVLY